MNTTANPGGGAIAGALILGLGAFLLLPAITKAIGGVSTGKSPGTTPGGGHSPGGSPPPAGTGPTPGGTPPSSHTGSGTTPAGDQVSVSFWADQFQYPQGATVTLYGQVLVNGHGQGGRAINIVDPDANPAAGGTAWLSTSTDSDGNYSISYTGSEGGHWRSYATDQSGVVSGVLDFWPQQAGVSPTPDPGSTSGNSDPQSVYNSMASYWASYSGLVDPTYPDITASFLDVWTQVQDELTGGYTDIDPQLMDQVVNVEGQLQNAYNGIAAGLNQ